MNNTSYEPAAPRKLFIDELETARSEVRQQAYMQDYTPTLKIMIEEAKIRALKFSEFESEIAEKFLKKYEELEQKWGKKGMKDKMEADEALEWLIAVESFYIDVGLLEYEEKEGNWIENELMEFQKKLERR
jgi:chemotaxis regulatin CheY-phosphate phosphatase CheZ